MLLLGRRTQMKILEQIVQLCIGDKQKIYWDIDDVVLKTNNQMVKLINEKYLKPNGLKEKSLENIKDWGFNSIYRELNLSQRIELFESEEFWLNVEINEDFLKIAQSGILKKYNNVFLTQGTEKNLKMKKEFLYNNNQLKKYIEKFDYIGLDINEKKSKINMEKSIQIDDNYENLKNTNASLKILVKNNIETNYNNSFGFIDTPDNLYNVNNLIEALDILKFNKEYNLDQI